MIARALLALPLLAAAACSIDRSGLGPADTERDAGPHPEDAGVDAARDGGGDAGAGDGGPDGAGPDAGMDGGADAGGMDGGDADGGPDGGPSDAGIDAPACDPVGSRRCVAGDLVLCTETGPVAETCVLGCTDSMIPPRCLQVQPSNVSDPSLLREGSAPLVVNAGELVVVDTDTGRIVETGSGTEVRAAGSAGDATGIAYRTQGQGSGWPELGIFAASAIQVADGGTLRATGSRALVLLSAGAVAIDGVIDVGARGTAPGPGGGAGGTGGDTAPGPGGGGGGGISGIWGIRQSAGGGGGHAEAGGQGGYDDSGMSTEPGGAGGAAIADESATPLVGGGGGGGGEDGEGVGGGGGGAIQITSNASISVGATGVVRAPGAGGQTGTDSGGGGGAGGTILLEAPTVAIAGVVVANGGGGGGGDHDGSSSGDPGQRGRDDTMRAAGGAGASAGNGGRGGAGDVLAGEPGEGGRGGGGGGGAAGRIRTHTAAGGLSLGGTTSPTDAAARTSGTITTF